MMFTQYFILKHLSHINILFGSPGVGRASTRNFLTFVKTTAIAGHKNPEALVDFLPAPVCNSGRVCRRRKIAGTVFTVRTHDEIGRATNRGIW